MQQQPAAAGPAVQPAAGAAANAAAYQAPPPPQQMAPPLMGLGVPQQQVTSYREFYGQPVADAFAGNYVNLYNEYSVGNTTPADLRNTIYRDGNTGTCLSVLIHVRDPQAAADDPGTIVGYHRLTRRDTRLGQTARPFDNQGLAFFGDVVNGQAPGTVVIPDALYNQLPVVQVPTDARLQQLEAAEPNETTYGPFAAGEPDVTPIATRGLVIVPNKYVAPFLTTGLRPKEAYRALKGMIQQDGNEVACAELLDWLRVTTTKRAPGQPPRTVQAPLAAPVFANPGDQQAFAAYRLELMHRDLPSTQPGVHHNSAALIAQGITALTNEQRQARQEAEQHRLSRDAPKTAADYFGVLLDRVMRWCQVASERDLPPIYDVLANTKKGKVRVVLQTAVEDALANLKYLEDFPLSPPLATKIVELKWHSPIKDDFTVGLNIFCLGSLEDETMEDQRRINHHADTIASGDAAPALMDVATIHDGKHDVCIPKSFAQLRYCVERSQALWQVLLGPQHPVTHQHQLYRNLLIGHEKRLERTLTRDPTHRYLVPALLARVIQLEMNHWLDIQLRTAAPVPFYQLTDVFSDIERERNWEPSFPARYIQTEMPAPWKSGPPQSTIVANTTATTAVSTLSNASGEGTLNMQANSHVTSAPRNTMVRNVSYRTASFEEFKALGIKIGRLKDRLKEKNVKLPSNAAGAPMCLAFHVLGYCNERCNSAKDHMAHTDTEDKALVSWCKEHFKLE